jgi:hypothetical protein
MTGERGNVDLPLPRSIVTPESHQPPRVPHGNGEISPQSAAVSEEQGRRREQAPTG